MNEPDAAADALGRRQAISLRSELASAKDEVAAGRSGFGEHHMTAAVRGASPAEVDAAVAEVQATLADLGIIAVREEIALEPAFWAQFPGNFKYIARRGLVSTGNFAGLAMEDRGVVARMIGEDRAVIPERLAELRLRSARSRQTGLLAARYRPQDEVRDPLRSHAAVSRVRRLTSAIGDLVPQADCLQPLRVSDAGRRQKVFGARTAVIMSRAMGKTVLRRSWCWTLLPKIGRI